jgi:hypothetical protein
MAHTDQTPTFDNLLHQIFNAYGAEYKPDLQQPRIVELRLESGQSLVFTESDNQQLVMIAELGDCPTEPEKLMLLLMANHQGLNPEYPHQFFVDPNTRACVSLSYPLATIEFRKVQQALEHLINCCEWFLALVSGTDARIEADISLNKIPI